MESVTAETSPENNVDMLNCSVAVCDLRGQGGEMEGDTAASHEKNREALNFRTAAPNLCGQGGGGVDGTAVRADGRGFGAAGRPGEPVRNVVLPPRFSSERFRTMILSRLREKNPE